MAWLIKKKEFSQADCTSTDEIAISLSEIEETGKLLHYPHVSLYGCVII